MAPGLLALWSHGHGQDFGMTLHRSQVGMELEEGSGCPMLKGLQAISEEDITVSLGYSRGGRAIDFLCKQPWDQ